MQLAALLFVISSMLAMSLSLTVHQITAPLKNVRLVVVALVLNFIVVPALAVGISAVLNLSEEHLHRDSSGGYGRQVRRSCPSSRNSPKARPPCPWV